MSRNLESRISRLEAAALPPGEEAPKVAIYLPHKGGDCPLGLGDDDLYLYDPDDPPPELREEWERDRQRKAEPPGGDAAPGREQPRRPL